MRLTLALLGLALCCAPAVLSAQPLPQAPNLDAAARKALSERYAKALSSELGLLKALDQLDRDADDLDARMVRLSVERAAATDKLSAQEDSRARAEQDLEWMRVAVQHRLRAILRIAHLPSLRFALSSKDFAESVVKDRLLRRLLAADRARLADYRQRLVDLQRLTAGRDAALKQLEQLDLQLHEERAKAEAERRDKLALIEQIDGDRKYQEKASRDGDAASKALAAEIATLQEWQERKYTFASTQGKLLPPVPGRIETGYGEIRNPRFGTVTLHRGLDFRAGAGTGIAVRAVFWGRVAYVGWLTGYGETVLLDHGHGWHTVYAHLENTRVAVGDVVAARVRIADIGTTGSIKGRYLYFEIRRNGQPVDPTPWFH